VPTVRVSVVSVLLPEEALWRTQIVWLGLMLPDADVKVAVQPIEYSPPLTLTGVAPLIR
jgi:hypothetical protein